MKKVLVLTVLVWGALQAQDRPRQHEIPLNQDISLGELTVSLAPSTNVLGSGLIINITSTTVTAAAIAVFSVVRTTDGKTQTCDSLTAWLPDHSDLSVSFCQTTAPVDRVLNIVVIPIDGNQIHGL